MKHGTSTGLIFVVLILVVLLCMVLFLTDAPDKQEEKQEEETGESLAEKTPDEKVPDEDDKKQDEETSEKPEPGRDVVEHVQQGQEMEQQQEAELQETQKESTESETVQQPQVPQFVPRTLGSGSFRSATGVDLNLILSWSAKTTSESVVELSVNVAVESYSLYSVATPGALKIYVYGQPTVLSMPAINLETAPSKVQTPVASQTYTINLTDGSSSTVPLSAEWLFGGSYSGTDLPVISCGGDAVISR